MAILADATIEVTDDRLAARNAVVLAAAQALAGGNTTGDRGDRRNSGIDAGADPALATLPISVMASACGSARYRSGCWPRPSAAVLRCKPARRLAWHPACSRASADAVGIVRSSAPGTLCGGLYAAAHQSYRFAAADTASAQFRAKAVSWVLGRRRLLRGDRPAARHPDQGCLAGRICSPATYLAQSACAVIAAAVLTLLKLPPARRCVADLCRRAAAGRNRARAAIHRRRRRAASPATA